MRKKFAIKIAGWLIDGRSYASVPTFCGGDFCSANVATTQFQIYDVTYYVPGVIIS